MIIVEQEIEDYTAINIVTRYPNWDSATTYNFGEVLFHEQYYYKSVVDNNLNVTPTDNPSEWLRWSVSNRYAQIDLRATTYTTWDATTATVPADNALISTFNNESYDIISFGGVSGASITVELYDNGDTLIHSETRVIYNRPNSNSWYNYYFDEFEIGVDASFLFRLPPQSGGYITTTVEADGDGAAQVGYMVAGSSVYVGDSLFGASLGLEDNSLIEIDDFGITTIVKRTANSFMDVDVVFPSQQVKQMERKASEVFGKIALFIGDESVDSGYEHLATLGYIEGYTTVLSNPIQTQASYSIREVI